MKNSEQLEKAYVSYLRELLKLIRRGMSQQLNFTNKKKTLQHLYKRIDKHRIKTHLSSTLYLRQSLKLFSPVIKKTQIKKYNSNL